MLLRGHVSREGAGEADMSSGERAGMSAYLSLFLFIRTKSNECEV